MLALRLICAPALLAKDPHKPIKNPDLTQNAANREGNLEKVLTRGEYSPEEKILEIEAALLHRWDYEKMWQQYLDMPLLAHAHAALGIKALGYDAVVGIENAGVAYTDIFRIMGCETSSVDYSHHKRKMEKPLIDPLELDFLKKRKKVLLVDVDFVTGRTIRTVTDYLRRENINVQGAYIGLSEWSGIPESDVPAISEDTVDFKNFWMTCGKTRQLRRRYNKSEPIPYKLNIIPKDIQLLNANPQLEHHAPSALAAAREIAQYLSKK
ncbi:MAG: phosphoribosyltransferase [Nanoarchaeota archaeon]